MPVNASVTSSVSVSIFTSCAPRALPTRSLPETDRQADRRQREAAFIHSGGNLLITIVPRLRISSVQLLIQDAYRVLA